MALDLTLFRLYSIDAGTLEYLTNSNLYFTLQKCVGWGEGRIYVTGVCLGHCLLHSVFIAYLWSKLKVWHHKFVQRKNNCQIKFGYSSLQTRWFKLG